MRLVSLSPLFPLHPYLSSNPSHPAGAGALYIC